MIKGSIVALITPFKNGAVDEAAFRKLVAFQIDNGTNGLVPVGTTGESPTIGEDDHWYGGGNAREHLGDRHLAPHDLALVVGITVVFPGAVVMVALGARVERREPLEPALVVLVQARLVVVDEDARGDVHRVDEAEPLGDAALVDLGGHLIGDVHEVHAGGDVQGQGLAVALHGARP